MNVAFYSYKGGVGRTQLVANLAQYLYKYENKKVLLMDWDLEAPGLHFYFGKDNKDIKKEGIIEVLSNYVKFARETEADEAKEEDFPFFTEENIINLAKDEKTKGKIDLIAGGIYEDFTAYRRKIIDFNWIEFYELLDGVRYVEFVLKKKLKELDYDFIFIDSRTGISDYQNICNIQLVDANVLLMAPNKQNVDGCMEVARSIIDSPYVKDGHREPIIFPILSRVEVDSPDFKDFNKKFKQKAKFLIKKLNELLEFEVEENDYYEDTRLYYNKFIAIGEHLLFKNKNENVEGFAEQYQNIAEYFLYGFSLNILDKKYKKHTSTFAQKIIRNQDHLNKLIDKLNYWEEQYALADSQDLNEKFRLKFEIKKIQEKMEKVRNGFDKHFYIEKIEDNIEKQEIASAFELGEDLVKLIGTPNDKQLYEKLKKEYMHGNINQEFPQRLKLFFRQI